MYSIPYLSEKSQAKINEIVELIQQNYPQIEINKDGDSITFIQNGKILNRFDFYASMFGSIESIAVYGIGLNDLLQTINRTKLILGLKVSDAEIDNGGFEDFLDVNLLVDKSLEDKNREDNYFKDIIN